MYTEKFYTYSKENFENKRKRKLKRKLEKKIEIELQIHEKEERKKLYEKEKLESLKKLNEKKKIPTVKDEKNEKCEKMKNSIKNKIWKNLLNRCKEENVNMKMCFTLIDKLKKKKYELKNEKISIEEELKILQQNLQMIILNIEEVKNLMKTHDEKEKTMFEERMKKLFDEKLNLEKQIYSKKNQKDKCIKDLEYIISNIKLNNQNQIRIQKKLDIIESQINQLNPSKLTERYLLQYKYEKKTLITSILKIKNEQLNRKKVMEKNLLKKIELLEKKYDNVENNMNDQPNPKTMIQLEILKIESTLSNINMENIKNLKNMFNNEYTQLKNDIIKHEQEYEYFKFEKIKIQKSIDCQKNIKSVWNVGMKINQNYTSNTLSDNRKNDDKQKVKKLKNLFKKRQKLEEEKEDQLNNIKKIENCVDKNNPNCDFNKKLMKEKEKCLEKIENLNLKMMNILNEIHLKMKMSAIYQPTIDKSIEEEKFEIMKKENLEKQKKIRLNQRTIVQETYMVSYHINITYEKITNRYPNTN